MGVQCGAELGLTMAALLLLLLAPLSLVSAEASYGAIAHHAYGGYSSVYRGVQGLSSQHYGLGYGYGHGYGIGKREAEPGYGYSVNAYHPYGGHVSLNVNRLHGNYGHGYGGYGHGYGIGKREAEASYGHGGYSHQHVSHGGYSHYSIGQSHYGGYGHGYGYGGYGHGYGLGKREAEPSYGHSVHTYHPYGGHVTRYENRLHGNHGHHYGG